jgi:hypothetical protein
MEMDTDDTHRAPAAEGMLDNTDVNMGSAVDMRSVGSVADMQPVGSAGSVADMRSVGSVADTWAVGLSENIEAVAKEGLIVSVELFE